MKRTILVDSSIAIPSDGEVAADGIKIERYDGQGDDKQLLEDAARRNLPAVVVAGDAFLVDSELVEEAKRLHLTLVVTHTNNPLDAADLVREHARSLLAQPAGVAVRLMADGPSPVQ